MKTIISVDGGGIKGIVAITILQAIQNKLPKFMNMQIVSLGLQPAD